tara:strand:+ start:159 stop:362 length:204 start_codon:yes stop_codon:yes gene_type:complete
MFTLKEIIDHWKECYGENMLTEYPGFIKQLIRNQKRFEKVDVSTGQTNTRIDSGAAIYKGLIKTYQD